jgi:hypothetical protein
MFYISPYFPCTLPVFSSIYSAVPYPVFLLLYIAAFLIGGGIVYGAAKGIEKLVLSRKAVAKA